MALNSSGPISLAGTTAGVSIEIENGGNGTTQISLNDTAVRSLAGVTTPGSTITMPTNFYGKSNADFTISPAFSSITNWSLTSNGPLNIGTTGTWNITMLSTVSVTIYMWGSGGGNGALNGAGGGFSSKTVTLSSGTTYCLRVGGVGTQGGGGGGGSGASGGGLSGVFSGNNAFSQGSAILIAGGGGGATGGYSSYGSPGAGGGSSGQSSNGGAQGGGGGSQCGGGSASAYNGAAAGSALQGGKGGGPPCDCSAGGGGGAGYYGGGGGNAGGGGGGSGYPSADTSGGCRTTPGNSGCSRRSGAGSSNTSGRIYIQL